VGNRSSFEDSQYAAMSFVSSVEIRLAYVLLRESCIKNALVFDHHVHSCDDESDTLKASQGANFSEGDVCVANLCHLEVMQVELHERKQHEISALGACHRSHLSGWRARSAQRTLDVFAHQDVDQNLFDL
jgi:hypothetical protein